METNADGFEIETCGRCAGTGRHSYNQTHGSVCYGCGGKGKRFTKRGKLAYDLFVKSLMVRLDALVVGDRIRVGSVTADGRTSFSYWAAVTDIQTSKTTARSSINGVWTEHPPGLEVTTMSEKFGSSVLHAGRDHQVRKAWDLLTKAARLADALTYQSSLTKKS